MKASDAPLIDRLRVSRAGILAEVLLLMLSGSAGTHGYLEPSLSLRICPGCSPCLVTGAHGIRNVEIN